MFDAEAFYKEYGIHYVTPGSGDKHSREGWIQVPCPFCTGHSGYHLGYNLEEGYYNCWRCGSKRIYAVIDALVGPLDENGIKDIYKRFQTDPDGYYPWKDVPKADKKQKLKLPEGTETLKKAHKQYLRGRGFDPDEIVDIWGIMGTTVYGNYARRIIIPIYYQGRLVSYHSRDITGRQRLRHKACEKAEEILDHKTIVYGFDHAIRNSRKKVIVVEGIFDVWKIGPGAVATFGIEVLSSQVRLLSKFEEVFVLFDNEPQALKNARKLRDDLLTLGSDSYVIKIPNMTDPAELSRGEARKLRQRIFGIESGKD